MHTRTPLHCVRAAIVMAASATAHADNTLFTNAIPECRSPSAGAIPEKYVNLAKRDKDFVWAARIRKTDKGGSSSGWELFEGSNMREWFSFYRADLNNDGYCDWYINAGSPQSSGGDRNSINTIHLGQPKGWLRIGAPLPNDKPDALGYGQADSQQGRYLFGEKLALLYDTAGRLHHMISSFENRHALHD